MNMVVISHTCLAAVPARRRQRPSQRRPLPRRMTPRRNPQKRKSPWTSEQAKHTTSERGYGRSSEISFLERRNTQRKVSSEKAEDNLHRFLRSCAEMSEQVHRACGVPPCEDLPFKESSEVE